MSDDRKDIRIHVESHYVETESSPVSQRYVFAYTVTIVNEGCASATLMNRHWIITDAEGRVHEIRGEGVVGEQPYLKPGAGFQYTSAAIIQTPLGIMQGSYEMLSDDGQYFDAEIPPFRLSMPYVLH